MMKPLYQEIASLVKARLNCLESGNHEWKTRHEDRIERLVKGEMPSGSGIDQGTTVDLHASTDEKLVFLVPFHHMDEHGFYDGWTEHRVIVTGSLWSGFNLRITGRDKNGIKDYLSEVYHDALGQEGDWNSIYNQEAV